MTFHGPTARNPMPEFSLRQFDQVLRNAEPAGKLERLPQAPGVQSARENRIVTLREGVAEGPLVGGNLSLLQCLIGTRFLPDFSGAILFLEDVGEALYRVDRMLAHFRAVGALSKLAGVLVGRFTDMKRDTGDGAFGFDEVLEQYFGGLGIPVAYGFPVGHIDSQWTMPLGVRARLDATNGDVGTARGGGRPDGDAYPYDPTTWPARSARSTSMCGRRARHARPAVVILHGFKGFKDWGMFPPLADRLARAGFMAVSFNMSGAGVDRDGNFTFPERFGHDTFSIELEDLQTVINALTTGSFEVAPPSSIGLLGHSRGGGVAVLEAARDERIAALVTWAAVSTVHRWPAATIAEWRKAGRNDIVNSRTGEVLPLYPDVLDDNETNAERLDILGAAGRITVPWLLVHGDADESVALEEGQRLAAVVRHPAAGMNGSPVAHIPSARGTPGPDYTRTGTGVRRERRLVRPIPLLKR